MLNFCNLNEQVIQNKTRFTIHDRRFQTPKRIKTEENNGPCIKRSFLSLQQDKSSKKISPSLNVKGASKSLIS